MQALASAATKKDIILYDGTCALCHWLVGFTLRHDDAGTFQLSPLQGETARQRISDEERAKLADSVVVLTAEGRMLTKSGAATYIGEKLGFGTTARLVRMLPLWLAESGYDVIARSRYRLFGRKQEMCPLVAPELRERFLP